ncbi:hypothetical protein GGE12_003230 [Rhizobium mongolense]|uniref:Uncharacterized protein n=1 Tax=Rhizobium mongolense TaxID=57676 RepID=A0A7W6RMW5_9HYPH|nr:hypothetical protein [Rhizobium mongolense]
MPSWRQKVEAQAPPVMINGCFLGHHGAQSAGRRLDAARRAILMPAASEFRATEGAVGEGSAVRSDGEKTPLFQRRPLALPVRLPAHCRACRSSRRGRFRKVVPVCPAIERPQRQNPVSSPVFGRKSLPQIDALRGDRKFAARRGFAGGTTPNSGSTAWHHAPAECVISRCLGCLRSSESGDRPVMAISECSGSHLNWR